VNPSPIEKKAIGIKEETKGEASSRVTSQAGYYIRVGQCLTGLDPFMKREVLFFGTQRSHMLWFKFAHWSEKA